MKIILAIATSLVISSGAFADTGFLDRSVTFQGESYSYEVYVPADYTPGLAWRAITEQNLPFVKHWGRIKRVVPRKCQLY